MKKVFLAFAIVFFAFVFLQLVIYRNPNPKEERLAGIVLQRSSNRIKSELDLIPFGSGVAMPGGPIRELCLGFATKTTLSKLELRKLLISAAKIMLAEVENEKEILPYLYTYPFTINNVQVVIYNHDKDGYEVYDPEIGVANLSQGIITFRTNDPLNEFVYKNRFKETYEEALKAIEEGS